MLPRLTAFSSPRVISFALKPNSFTSKSILLNARNGPSMCAARHKKYSVTFNSAASSMSLNKL